ncbi:hypothetical protein D3C72_1783410 [compost metagenome]
MHDLLQVALVDQHALQLVIQRLAEVHQHIAALFRVKAGELHLDAVEGLERLDLGQLLGLEHEVHAGAEGVHHLLEQFLVSVGLEQHGIRQAAHHHPFAQGNGEGFVVVDVRVGGEEGVLIGVGLGRLIGDALDLLVAHAAGADCGDQFGKLLFHGRRPVEERSKGRRI